LSSTGGTFESTSASSAPGAVRRIVPWELAPVGLGAMPLSTHGRPERPDAIRTLHAALDAGARLVDTADAYCLDAGETGHNEALIAEALRARPSQQGDVLVATKGGHVRGHDGSWSTDGRPSHLRAACEASLRALRRDVIDLYQFHRPDPAVPFAESVGAMADLRDAGLVRHVGLSNVDAGQIAEAQEIVEITSVQNELSPDFRTSLGEVEACEAAGIAFLAYAPLGGAGGAPTLGDRHPAFARVGARLGVTPQQVAIGWVLAQSPVVLAIPGARRPATFLDSFQALDLELTPEDLADLEGR
jgi:aryl-alcohol dehydrogenase-like predicted oxidoreductase